MNTYQVTYNATTKVAKIQIDGTAVDTGFSKVGSFACDRVIMVHPTYYRFVRPILTDAAITDVRTITVELPVMTVVSLPAAVTLSLAAGQKTRITNTLIPDHYAANATITYTSSAPAIATVDSTGLVTPVAVGTVTITVTANPGQATDTCVITVVA